MKPSSNLTKPTVRLVPGPFPMRSSINITGIPESFKEGLLNLKRSAAPHFDAAIHLRNSFDYFEHMPHPGDSDGSLEAFTWLNSSKPDGAKMIFLEIERKLKETLILDYAFRSRAQGQLLTHPVVFNVYLSADSSFVKERLFNSLSRRYGTATNFYFSYGQSEKIEFKAVLNFVLINNLNGKLVHFNKMRNNVKGMKLSYAHTTLTTLTHLPVLCFFTSFLRVPALSELAFDWYALSISRNIITWRSFPRHISTFAKTASSVSGTTEKVKVCFFRHFRLLRRILIMFRHQFQIFTIYPTYTTYMIIGNWELTYQEEPRYTVTDDFVNISNIESAICLGHGRGTKVQFLIYSINQNKLVWLVN